MDKTAVKSDKILNQKSLKEKKESIQSTPLDLMNFPLVGRALIEASAGTGKTYSIAILYLRLLLQIGTQHYLKPLTVQEILVVTFTKAATEELRNRIRENIHHLRHLLSLLVEYDVEDLEADPIFKALIIEIKAKRDIKEVEHQLRVAEESMDEAAIYTIDSFSLRLIERNAFELKQYFKQSFVNDEYSLEILVVRQFWRDYFTPIDSLDLANLIRDSWKTPEDLLSDVRPFLKATLPTNVKLSDNVDLKSQFESLKTGRESKIKELLTLWGKYETTKSSIFDELCDGRLKQNSAYKNHNIEQWLDIINRWVGSQGESHSFNAVYEIMSKFKASALTAVLKKGESLPKTDLFDKLESTLSEQLVNFKEQFYFPIVNEIRGALQNRKRYLAQMTHGDALIQLNQALLDTSIKTNLVPKITQQYPVALIDEFQDTNKMQYDLFDTLYHNRTKTGLFLIGDPKQAIYGFRGGDIFTYMAAKSGVDALYSMDTNWRSSPKIIDGVNQLFSYTDTPFLYDAIPFYKMKAAPKNSENAFKYGQQECCGIELYSISTDEEINKGNYQQESADYCARKIAHWLMKGAMFVNKKGERKINTSDITILVRSSSEAKTIKDALSKYQIKSVYLSDNESVFSSIQAQELLRILHAINRPNSLQTIASALSTQLLHRTMSQIAALEEQSVLENYIREFSDYAELYTQSGMLVMLHKLMSQYHIAENLLSIPSGDRILTNFMHLSELLQVASMEHNSLSALIQWFSEQMIEPDSELENHEQRLESDENLIKIMTFHKSKGLEFPVVCIPFAVFFNQFKGQIYHDEDRHQPHFAFKQSEKDKQEKIDSMLVKEQTAEDLRLLYVAVTRAEYHCLMGIAKVKNAKSSAINSLVLNQHSLAELVNEESHSKKSMQFNFIDTKAFPEMNVNIEDNHDGVTLKANVFKRKLDHSWRVTSYSGLLVSQDHDTLQSNRLLISELESEKLEELSMALEIIEPSVEIIPELSDIKDAIVSDDEMLYTIHQLPKGAFPGTQLHTLFESIDFTADPNEFYEAISVLIKALRLEEEQWQISLHHWLCDVLNTPLKDDKLTLSQISNSQKLVELQFYLPIDQKITGREITELLRQHDPLSKQADILNFSEVEGMLKGFIDLVFEYEGRYYIADYKSNYLGENEEAYTQENIAQAMIDHRYDFQYQLYTLALHRYLEKRIPNYDYETHFGGIFYLFIRGMSPLKPGSGVYYTRPSYDFITQLNEMFKG